VSDARSPEQVEERVEERKKGIDEERKVRERQWGGR